MARRVDRAMALAVVAALIAGAAARAADVGPCRPDVAPAAGRHFEAGDRFLGVVDVDCPAGTAALDLYTVAAFTGTTACPDDHALVFAEPDHLAALCRARLGIAPAPRPTVAGLAPPAGLVRRELVDVRWPGVQAEREFSWGVCAVAAGGDLLAPGMRCSLVTATQTADRAFSLGLPVAAGETANGVFGVWPFGVHGSVHSNDGGHPGWDLEFVAGAHVRAAADGIVQSVTTDADDPTKVTVQVSHAHGRDVYRTVYTNIESPSVVPGAPVTAGQPLGRAGRSVASLGNSQVAYYMTHFQVDHLTGTPTASGVSNPYARSPQVDLTPEGRTLFSRVWSTAAYQQELAEPFPTNPRASLAPFPIRRSWLRERAPDGTVLPARIDFSYRDPAVDPTAVARYDYSLLDRDGIVLETGSATVAPGPAPPSRIDLQPRDASGTASGPPRAGLYDVVGGMLAIDWGPPGAARPSDLSNAAVYTTP